MTRLAGHAPSGFFALRTPLLPFDDVLALASGFEATSAADEHLHEAVERDQKLARERLRAIVARPEVREAIFLGSPDLESGIALWETDPESRRAVGIERALLRYVLRMAGRATPFGLFAGCSVGEVGPKTQLTLASRAEYRRRSRLDMGYLDAVVGAVAADPDVRDQLRYRPNTSLYRISNSYRYVQTRSDGTRRTHHLVTVRATDTLGAIMAAASGGAGARPPELVDALVTRGIDRSRAEDYVGDLIASQLLTPEIGPCVTGADPLAPLLAELRAINGTQTATVVLSAAGSQLAQIDQAGLGTAPARYRELAADVEPLGVAVDLPKLVQVDMVKPATASLGPAVLAEITRGIHLLHALAPPAPATGALTDFVRNFEQRYEDREVPLVEALDSEHGIGFGSTQDATPLLRGIIFPPPSSADVAWRRRERWLLRLAVNAAARGAAEVELDVGEVRSLADGDPAPLPDAVAAIATVVAPSSAELDAGRFRVVLDAVIGPSGARLLGRFCPADPALEAAVRTHLAAEEALDPEAVHAEIVHLPEGRIGNVLVRPVLREYELPFLGRSGADSDRQIPVTDLLVSVRGGRIVLRSARLDRRVIPRLTSAHNFGGRSVPLYRFLCGLQAHGTVEAVSWKWGPLDRAPSLPRVTCGRLVLARARWCLDKHDIARLCPSGRSATFRAWQQWRRERRAPRFCTIADGDNSLPIDLDNVLSVEAAAHVVRRREEAVIEELFPDPEHLCVTGPEGRFTHELVVPFVRLERASPVVSRSITRPMARSFPPGTEWLYLRLYGGASVLDDVLRAVHPIVADAVSAGDAERWFFVRYADPNLHLRLRVRGEPETLDREVLPAVRLAVAPFVDTGTVWRVDLGTYEREVARYGGPEAMLLSERAFHADSEAVAGIVARLSPGDEGSDQRWRLALRGMDMLLDDLGFELGDKAALLTDVRRGFAKEHRVNGPTERKLGARFREERAILERLLDPANDAGSPLAPGFRLLAARSERMVSVAAGLRELDRAGQLTAPLTAIAESLLHMHANRLLRSAARAQELVLYDFLLRLYRSEQGRSGGG